ncbi:DUF2884 family protein [Xanthomonas sp. AmX2]|uniref:DUF2884 family protein n=1 Tax=Xanthomonas sp. TaxID=29446 RepID=UPI00197FEB97|nr:DUF2884 family protein [Xanthomonas sp.]MBN6148751.1 DUF2884 family protein [Xanthomonas sp.]
MQPRHLPLAALALMLALSACQRSAPQADADTTSGRGHGLTFNGGDITLHADGAPDATITRAGDLLIDGKPVAVTPAQHALVAAYREQLEAVGLQGLEIGKQGAALGVKAAGDALAGVISGDADKVGAQIEAQAEKLKHEALKICDRVATLRLAQDTLVAQLPAFRPYASLDASDISDCRDESSQH